MAFRPNGEHVSLKGDTLRAFVEVAANERPSLVRPTALSSDRSFLSNGSGFPPNGRRECRTRRRRGSHKRRSCLPLGGLNAALSCRPCSKCSSGGNQRWICISIRSEKADWGRGALSGGQGGGSGVFRPAWAATLARRRPRPEGSGTGQGSAPAEGRPYGQLSRGFGAAQAQRPLDIKPPSTSLCRL
ncbi:hypothetical protein PCL_05816 [Purpureocillium lilacinum]|uniref:Uncharacterized protein n=1 Tax=Purpureocillium lilacinum TaxID=33203 RepID=A0A2U3EKX4_PURLI|nr:hypothetical protein PCL_05816 [Purpureocillium lilacinum]